MKRYRLWILALLLVIVAVFALIRRNRNEPSEKVVAVVNGEVISYNDLRREIVFSSVAGVLDSTKLSTREKKKIEKNVLEDLVIHKILLQEAQKKGIQVSDTEVDNYISGLVEGLSQGYVWELNTGDSTNLNEAVNNLYQVGLSKTDKINVKKGQFFVMNSRLYFFYPEFENPYVITFNDSGVESIIELGHDTFVRKNKVKIVLQPPLHTMLAKVGIDYNTWRERVREDLIIDKLIKDEVYDKIVVTNKELRDEYKNNKDKYYQPERYEIRQIFIQRSYNESEDKKQLALAQRIRRKLLRKRSTFSELAKKYSQSPEAKKGGYLGYVKLSQLPVEFSMYLPKMRKYQISKIIETPFGYHIVQLLDKVPAYNRPLKEVKGEIIEKLKRQKVDKKFAKWLSELEKKSVITIYYNYFEVDDE